MSGSLGSLVIELAANTARLQSDMGKAVGIAERGAAKMASAFKFITAGASGGLIGAALIGAAKNAIEFGDNLNKAAIKAGVGGKQISELAYAAKLADIDIDTLSTALKKMQVSLSNASTGAKEPKLALDALGITLDQIRARRPDQQFELIGDRISKLQDPADRVRAAVELFGKAGADLLPLFSQGAAGIAKARQEAEKLGLSFSDDQLTKLADADDSVKRLDAAWQGLATTFTARVAPGISGVLDLLSGLDTRSLAQQLDDQITSLQHTIDQGNFGVGGGVGGQTDAGRASAIAELVGLKNRRGLLNAPKISGGPLGRGPNVLNPLGFDAADAGDKAATAAAAAQKEWQKFQDWFAESQQAQSEEIFKSGMAVMDDQLDAQLENARIFAAAQKEIADDAAKYQKQKAEELAQTAGIFKDAFINAWDDMINTGKFKWGELLKFIVAEFAKRGIAKLFDQMFSGAKSSGGSSGDGFWATVGSAVASVFGGARADGGPVQAGRSYLVGERGREIFTAGSNGYISPHGSGGGGGFVLAPVYNIDARGASIDLARALPGILRQNNLALESRMVEKLKHKSYGDLPA